MFYIMGPGFYSSLLFSLFLSLFLFSLLFSPIFFFFFLSLFFFFLWDLGPPGNSTSEAKGTADHLTLLQLFDKLG